jgi:hypothetical protein
MRKTRLTLLGVLASLLVVAPGVAAPGTAFAKGSCKSKAHAHFVGLGGGDSFVLRGHARNCMLARQARAGTGILRQQFGWTRAGAPTTPIARGKRFHFGAYDSWVKAVARHHMRVLAILSNSQGAAPKNFKGFKRFATAMVHRYGPHGSLWKGKNRKYRKWAIHSWQIWNEPNIPQYWGNHVSAKQYVKLLKAGYKGIKRADKHAEVVTAGLPESLIHGAVQATKYIPQLYKHGAKRWFTSLAINPYGPTAGNVMKNIAQARKIMRRHHDRGGKIWVSEVGWGTGGPASRFNVGTKGQARQVGKLLKKAYHHRRGLKIRGLVYYGWKDKAPYSGKDMWGLHTGLHTLSGAAKPSFKVFARVAPHLH